MRLLFLSIIAVVQAAVFEIVRPRKDETVVAGTSYTIQWTAPPEDEIPLGGGGQGVYVDWQDRRVQVSIGYWTEYKGGEVIVIISNDVKYTDTSFDWNVSPDIETLETRLTVSYHLSPDRTEEVHSPEFTVLTPGIEPAADDRSTPSRSGRIIGGAVGGVAVVIVIGVGIYYLLRRRKKKRQQQQEQKVHAQNAVMMRPTGRLDENRDRGHQDPPAVVAELEGSQGHGPQTLFSHQ